MTKSFIKKEQSYNVFYQYNILFWIMYQLAIRVRYPNEINLPMREVDPMMVLRPFLSHLDVPYQMTASIFWAAEYVHFGPS